MYLNEYIGNEIFKHVKGDICVRECHSTLHMITSIGIKGILNHHCAVYIHGSGNHSR